MRATNEVTNDQSIIDSRDVMARIEYLNDERTDLIDSLSEAQNAVDELDEDDECNYEVHSARDDADDELKRWDEENGEEFSSLRKLAEQGESLNDWVHGVTLIREDYFTDYSQELISGIGDLPKDIPSYLVIDWDATAENLKVDYTDLDFDGVTYFAR